MWVKECRQCKQRNPPQPLAIAPLGTTTASTPFEKLCWDIMGLFRTSSRGAKYLLVITDVFTTWVEVFAIHSTVAQTLARVLVNELICCFWVPTTLFSDQGANLQSEVIQAVCRLLGVDATQIMGYHPQGNCQV